MKIAEGDWKTFGGRALAHGVILAACVVGAMHAAHAWEGRSSVETRSFFTVAGTLAGVPTSPTPTLRFAFHKVGETTPCPPIEAAMVTYNGTTFSAQIPYEACGRGFFDGTNITVDVAVNGTSVVVGQAVNPVPYAHFASVAGQVSVDNDCPAGYSRDTAEATYVVCRKSLGSGDFDEVVKVGMGATAFWMDRYEATVCSSREGRCGMLINARVETDLASLGLPRSGNWVGRAPPLVARSSRYTNQPTRWVTWFQAEALCRGVGKRLPTGNEWLTAARGTGGSTGDTGCQVAGSDPREVASGSTCVSEWGAQDTVGNVWEWTAEWAWAAESFTTLSRLSSVPRGGDAPAAGAWGFPEYNGDATDSIAYTRLNPGTSTHARVPGAVIRGGCYSDQGYAGIFSANAANAPTYWAGNLGFRCVIPR